MGERLSLKTSIFYPSTLASSTIKGEGGRVENKPFKLYA